MGKMGQDVPRCANVGCLHNDQITHSNGAWRGSVCPIPRHGVLLTSPVRPIPEWLWRGILEPYGGLYVEG